MKVAEAVGLSADEFHFVVEAFGDSIVAGKAPHGRDLIAPGVQGFAELYKLRYSGVAQLLHGAEEPGSQVGALSLIPEARSIIERMRVLDHERYVSPQQFAFAYAGLKDTGATLAALEHGVHFVVEAFGDSIVAGEAPHGRDLIAPGVHNELIRNPPSVATSYCHAMREARTIRVWKSPRGGPVRPVCESKLTVINILSAAM